MATSRTFGQFARRLARRAREVENGTEKIVQSAALTGLQVAVFATPVRTGFARAGWFPSFGTPADDLPVGEPGEAAAAAQSIGRGTAIIPTWKITDPPIFLTNNVPYIVPLDNGSSAQAPAGMSQQAILAASEVLRRGRVFSGF